MWKSLVPNCTFEIHLKREKWCGFSTTHRKTHLKFELLLESSPPKSGHPHIVEVGQHLREPCPGRESVLGGWYRTWNASRSIPRWQCPLHRSQCAPPRALLAGTRLGWGLICHCLFYPRRPLFRLLKSSMWCLSTPSGLSVGIATAKKEDMNFNLVCVQILQVVTNLYQEMQPWIWIFSSKFYWGCTYMAFENSEYDMECMECYTNNFSFLMQGW